MKVFLSALENAQCSGCSYPVAKKLVEEGVNLKWNLMSYYYIQGKKELAEFIRDNSEEILIDSGAHSFQKGKKVDWDKYTEEYAAFIKEFDRPNVIGYFEMDVDNIIGYDKVLELRQKLEGVTDKIIPVWHKNRGVDGYVEMCRQYAGKIVAITGFRNMEIKDDQYLMFLKKAKEYGCKVHCLGMTRKKILDVVPFDYTDSSTWIQKAIRGDISNHKVTKDFTRTQRETVFIANYKLGIEMQEHYHRMWKKVCGD